MNAEDRALVAQNLLFRGVDFASVDYLLDRCTLRALAAGEVLLQPETPNHHLYLILEGELGVQLVDTALEPLSHTSLPAGVCAGEISIVDGKPPSARVVATVPSRVLAVPHDELWAMVDHSHAVARNLLDIVAGRMRHDNKALTTSQLHRVRFERQASVDALTGLHNRRWMEDAFPRTLQRCRRDREPVALLLADIDHFKRINDRHGHLVGDLALQAVAECMDRHLRPSDLLVRYGGEEFAMLLPGSGTGVALQVAERVRSAVAGCEVRGEGYALGLSISIGLAMDEGRDLQALLASADRALYRAKQAGRNRVEAISAVSS